MVWSIFSSSTPQTKEVQHSSVRNSYSYQSNVAAPVTARPPAKQTEPAPRNTDPTQKRVATSQSTPKETADSQRLRNRKYARREGNLAKEDTKNHRERPVAKKEKDRVILPREDSEGLPPVQRLDSSILSQLQTPAFDKEWRGFDDDTLNNISQSNVKEFHPIDIVNQQSHYTDNVQKGCENEAPGTNNQDFNENYQHQQYQQMNAENNVNGVSLQGDELTNFIKQVPMPYQMYALLAYGPNGYGYVPQK